MIDLPDGIHDLTDEDWDHIRAVARGDMVQSRWVVADCDAYLAAAAALWATLTKARRRMLVVACGDVAPSVNGASQYRCADALCSAGLLYPPSKWHRRYSATPLGRAVAYAGGAK